MGRVTARARSLHGHLVTDRQTLDVRAGRGHRSRHIVARDVGVRRACFDKPFRSAMSPKTTPAASTLTGTSPAPGGATRASRTANTSGPPLLVVCTACPIVSIFVSTVVVIPLRLYVVIDRRTE